MSVSIVSTDSTLTYYEQTTQLEGVTYLMRFQWADRENSWYLNIYEQDLTPLALSVRLMLNGGLLRQFSSTALPPGVLLCVDQSGLNQDISESSDLGTRVLLTYISSDDPVLA